MTTTINDILQPIAGYLLSITRNTEGGWYELEIGMPIKWVYKENEEIDCIVVSENENGRLIKITPKFDDVTIDDLVKFVITIIKTNERIKNEELEFQKRVEQYKENLEKDAQEHFNKLDELTKSSFENLDVALNNTIDSADVDMKRTYKPRKPKAKFPTSDNIVEE